MGTDITMYVEYKLPVEKDPKQQWHTGDLFHQTPFNESAYQLVPLYDDRCYSLFAVLADVRNYGHTRYIDEPRGLPEDVTEFVRDQFDDDWGHSCSYFTLRELIDFHEKKYPLRRSGMVSPEASQKLDLGILPETWCQGTGDPTWVRREWEEENNVLVPLIEKLKNRADELHLIPIYFWRRERDQYADYAYQMANNIRIIFWFDC